jgi:hypothetical protein
MDWTVEIPFRAPEQPILDALCDTVAIEDDESRVVAQAILGNAAESRVETVGDVLRELRQMDPEARRSLLDAARERAGLESTGDVEAHERFNAAQHAAYLRRSELERRPAELQPRMVADPSGGFELVDPVEIERDRRRDALRAEEDRQRREQREREAAEHAASERSKDDAWRPSGPGWDRDG